MRYITNYAGYVVTVAFGADVECDWGVCTEYTGAVPTGYTSLEDWYTEEVEKLYRWRVVNGQLTADEEAVAPHNKSIFDLIYPIGSIYMSVSPVSPATLFGGTWERIQDTFLLAAGLTYEAGTTGGEAEHNRAGEELPEHNHGLTDGDTLGLRGVRGQVERFHVSAGSDYYAFAAPNMDGMVYDGNVASTGLGQAHNNMPPYLAVYMWKRVLGSGEEPDSPGGEVVGGITITDDGAGNVIIEARGVASILDDGAGNVTIF